MRKNPRHFTQHDSYDILQLNGHKHIWVDEFEDKEMKSQELYTRLYVRLKRFSGGEYKEEETLTISEFINLYIENNSSLLVSDSDIQIDICVEIKGDIIPLIDSRINEKEKKEMSFRLWLKWSYNMVKVVVDEIPTSDPNRLLRKNELDEIRESCESILKGLNCENPECPDQRSEVQLSKDRKLIRVDGCCPQFTEIISETLTPMF